jgi:serine protease
MLLKISIRRVVLACLGLLMLATASARAADYVPGQVVVGYQPGPVAHVANDLVKRMGIRAAATPAPEPSVQVLQLPRGTSVQHAIATLSHKPGIAYVVPNFIAHEAGAFYPNDTGRSRKPGGWKAMQWNFLAAAGVDAPDAWSNLIADRRPGGKGVVVAILDTGIAYRNWRQFRQSPDFVGTKFVSPHDFVAKNPYPLDREGHGTFVAGTVAETTNNRFGLTGLAYGASIMPVRILGADGSGDAATISRGIRYAADHHAQVINLSIEFPLDTTASDIPDILSALRYAHSHGVLVVAAAGNEGADTLAYPAKSTDVVSVGATTRDRCRAAYSNGGPKLELVAPGGGDDMFQSSDPNCHPGRNLPNIYQMTLTNPPRWGQFGYPGGFFGTSMATPHVAAAAALVIASGVVGRHPSPAQVLTRLEQTARTLGGSKPNSNYGWGLVDAAAATARG